MSGGILVCIDRWHMWTLARSSLRLKMLGSMLALLNSARAACAVMWCEFVMLRSQKSWEYCKSKPKERSRSEERDLRFDVTKFGARRNNTKSEWVEWGSRVLYVYAFFIIQTFHYFQPTFIPQWSNPTKDSFSRLKQTWPDQHSTHPTNLCIYTYSTYSTASIVSIINNDGSFRFTKSPDSKISVWTGRNTRMLLRHNSNPIQHWTQPIQEIRRSRSGKEFVRTHPLLHEFRRRKRERDWSEWQLEPIHHQPHPIKRQRQQPQKHPKE